MPRLETPCFQTGMRVTVASGLSQPVYQICITDPWDCSTRGSDFYSNVPFNIHWINEQIKQHSNRLSSGGFTCKKPVFDAWFSVFAYVIQLF